MQNKAFAPVDRFDNRAPAVSVLLPVYNSERYVRKAIESVLAQTFADFELLIIDDGSTDRSLDIVREYEAKDSRVHIFSRENRGLVSTLNELIEKSRGRYLARMDADDICLPDRFKKQVAFLDMHCECAIVGSFREVINSKGQRIEIVSHPTHHDEIDQLHLKGHCCFTHPSVMLRKSVAISLDGYDPQFEMAEDLEFWLRLAECGKMANLPEVLIQYRVHDKAISEFHRLENRRVAQLACERAWARRGINGKFEATEQWRPGSDRESRHKFALQYGWIAWGNRNRNTWWTYVGEAFRLQPFALSTWQLLFFGMFKRPSKRTRARR